MRILSPSLNASFRTACMAVFFAWSVSAFIFSCDSTKTISFAVFASPSWTKVPFAPHSSRTSLTESESSWNWSRPGETVTAILEPFDMSVNDFATLSYLYPLTSNVGEFLGLSENFGVFVSSTAVPVFIIFSAKYEVISPARSLSPYSPLNIFTRSLFVSFSPPSLYILL